MWYSYSGGIGGSFFPLPPFISVIFSSRLQMDQSNSALILVVDDSQKIISFLVDDVLPYLGYQTRSTMSGVQALQIIKKEPPDVILLDLKLPDMEGLSLVEKLRQDKITTPVIMMTGHGSEETVVRALRLGVQDYLIKPFTANDVAAAIERTLRISRLEQEKEQLSQQLEQRIEELKTIESIGHHVAAVLDLDTLLSRIVEGAVFITKANAGFLLLLDEETGDLYLRAAKNVGVAHSRLVRRKVKDDLLGRVIRTGQPIRYGQGSDPGVEFVTNIFTRAILSVPLKTTEQVIGVLSVHNYTKPRGFSPNEQERLSALANYAVIALQNAKQYEALIKTQERLVATKTVIWMGTFGSSWAHSITQKVSTLRNYLATLKHHPHPNKPEILAKAEAVATSIQEFPFMRELPIRSEAVIPLLIDQTLQREVERLARPRPDVTLEFDLHSAATIRVDPNFLIAAIEILINNSLKAMPQGGTLKIAATLQGRQVAIEIIDTGHGIPEQCLPHFLKGPIPKKDGQNGTGTGVLIARSIILYYDGELELLWSEPGRGTALRIVLPVAKKTQEKNR